MAIRMLRQSAGGCCASMKRKQIFQELPMMMSEL
jgi:hypothetical protein